MRGWIRSIDEGFAFIPALNNVQCCPMMRPLCSRARTTTRGRQLTSQVSLASGASLLGCERRSREMSTSKDFFESLSKNLGLVVNLVLWSNEQHYNLIIRRTCKFIPPPWYKRGGLVLPPLPPGFLICCNISKWFCLQWKAFDFLYKMRYIAWVVRCWRSLTSPNMVAKILKLG